jgi:hypothetical protein
MPGSEEERRERVAAELQRVREASRQEIARPREAADVLPAPRPTASADDLATLPHAKIPDVPPAHPDNAAVNQLWSLPLAHVPRGVSGRIFHVLRRYLAPVIEAQTTFNSRQAQLDNEILAYVDARFDQTHRHYDRVLGDYGRHIADIDQRHLILQGELVAHVHDLVKRIDLVLGESERGRVSLEAALRDVRMRLVRLEERLAAK